MLLSLKPRPVDAFENVLRFFAPLTLLLALLSTTSAFAQSPRVEFDVPCLTPVIELGASDTHSNYVEVEARVPISILLSSGSQNQLSEVVIRIESRHREAQVIDFAPRTKIASSVVGNVEVIERGDERKHAEINLFGVAPAAPTIHGKANAGYRQELATVWSYERLPPQEVVVASGTTDRGFGAFFKFRPSSQASLEGSHDLLLRLRVPKDWRSEIYDVTAIAYSRRGKEFSFDDRPIAGQENFTLVFYKSGDEDARKSGAKMAMAEEQFRAVVWRDRKSIERKAFPSPLEKVGSVIGVVGPKIPSTWYQDLLNGKSDLNGQITQHLPKEVQAAAFAMIEKRELYEEMRASPPPVSKRRQKTIVETRLANSGPALSAKKPSTPWKARQPEEARNR